MAMMAKRAQIVLFIEYIYIEYIYIEYIYILIRLKSDSSGAGTCLFRTGAAVCSCALRTYAFVSMVIDRLILATRSSSEPLS